MRSPVPVAPRKTPWLVNMHYRMRTLAFCMLMVATILHGADRGYSPTGWALLGLLFLVYPQLQYWRACRADDPVKAEMTSLRVDSVLLGIYAAGVAFSPWLVFSAALGTFTNNTANKGWRGIVETSLALLGGALLWIAWYGFSFVPDTGAAATLFCMVGLTAYLLLMNNLGYTRNNQLRLAREQLQASERALLATNETLLRSLHEIDELHQQLREQANRDPLTGLYNRRYLDSTLSRELARCKRDGHALALLIIDIDHFKGINDSYGHQAGDAMLIRLGEMLLGMARAGDVACRYGGEEFLLLMPTMARDAAQARAEQLRTGFGGAEVHFGDFRLRATLSIGVAVYPGHGTAADELIRNADHALYQAKRLGRDRVEVAAGGSPD